jgi:hypothetical protein
MKQYVVFLEQSKSVVVEATDVKDAMDKAEAQENVGGNKWVAFNTALLKQ